MLGVLQKRSIFVPMKLFEVADFNPKEVRSDFQIIWAFVIKTRETSRKVETMFYTWQVPGPMVEIIRNFRRTKRHHVKLIWDV